MYYCIGDIHGCYDDLMRLIDEIEHRDKDARYLFLGDLIDRGPQVYEVLQWSLSNISSDGKFQSLRGNHEENIIRWYAKWKEWQKNTVRTLQSPETKYMFHQVLLEHDMLKEETLEPIIKLFSSFPYNKDILMTPVVDGMQGNVVHYFIAHGWYLILENKDTEKQHWVNLNGRSCDGISMRELDRYREDSDEIPIVICGHTPTISSIYTSSKSGVEGANAPGMIGYRPHTVFADGGCWRQYDVLEYPCMLGALCLDTLEEIYPCSLSQRMEHCNEHLMEYSRNFLQAENPYRKALIEKILTKGEHIEMH